jgi:hypothetical protein
MPAIRQPAPVRDVFDIGVAEPSEEANSISFNSARFRR